MTTLSGGNIKPFIGTYDFEVSRDFYVAIGFTLNWEQPDLAELELGDSRIFLQRFYNKEWVNNTMLHLNVNDAEAWYAHVKAVIDSGKYETSIGSPRVAPPKKEDYGDTVVYVWDPAGNLLHLGQREEGR